jgi:4-amino-4-deoxy-L-arabinose transferase-like glycosyltransferase
MLTIAVVAAVFVGLKLPSLDFAEIENDELVYVSVAANLKLHGRYSLQGTQVLDRLSADVYDRPLFHHPPVAVWLMEKTLGPGRPARSPVVVSWLGHALALAGLMLWLRALIPGQFSRLAPWALLMAALDPLAVHSGQRIWLDALAGGLVALGTGLYLTVASAGSRMRENLLLMASGAALGLAVTTKLPAALAFPVIALAFVLRGSRRDVATAVRHVTLVGIPAALIVAPWFVVFFRQYGMLFPDWIKPDAWMMEAHPFVKSMRERPPFYFFLQTLAVYPWLLLTAWTAVRAYGRKDGTYTLPLAFVLWVLTAITGLAVFAGHGFQMRYLGLYVAPLYALFALTLRDLLANATRFVPLFAAGAVSAAACAVAHVIRHTWFDVRSWFQILG